MNPGAQTYQVTLHRDDQGQSWGFRMQGGSDFSTPLSIQLVNPGSLAERCNLLPGDAVLSINGKDTANLEHENAKYEILMAQHDLSLVIQRGAVNIWKPKVTPLSDIKPAELKKMGGLDEDVLIQKTSLAATPQNFNPVGSNYNRTARGFGGFGGGAPAAAPAPQQYAPPPQQQQAPPPQYGGGASPYGGQQGGMQGAQQQMAGLSLRDHHDPSRRSSPPSRQVARPHSPHRSASPSLLHVPQDDGHKQERSVSPTFLAVQEEERERQKQRVEVEAEPAKQSRSFRALEEGLIGGGAMSGFRSVKAPTTKPPSERPQQVHPVCAVCGGLCIGVFVKIHGEPIHPECFKCTRCGKNLKNQGHFTIEGKKYCDACAEAVAAPPGPDMEAVPVYR